MSTIDKISEKLIANGKTQKDLTDFLGLKKSTFSGWKSGKTKSYLKYIKEIAVFLGTSIDELLSEEDDKNRPVDIEKAIGQIASMTYSKTETEKFVDSLFESFAESLSVPLINTITKFQKLMFYKSTKKQPPSEYFYSTFGRLII